MTIRRKRIRVVAAQSFLTALLCVGLMALTVSSNDLVLRRDSSSEVRVLAPHLHFLMGKSLDRLHDGAIVPFDFQLSVAAGTKNQVVARSLERFSISYDVWREKFSVVRLRDLRKSPALSGPAAEAWCVDNIGLPAATLPSDRDLWARLEIRTVDQHAQASALSNAGISVTTLIELFSRPPRPQQDRWSLETASFRLADLQPRL